MARSSEDAIPGEPRYATRVARINRRVLFYYRKLHSTYRFELHVCAGGALHDLAAKRLAGISGGVAPGYYLVRSGWTEFDLGPCILRNNFHPGAVSGDALRLAGPRSFTILSAIAYNIS